MLRYSLFSFTIYMVCLIESVSAGRNFGPSYPPTKGEVWPKPRNQKKQDTFFILPSSFQFEVKENNCAILTNAIDRYKKTLKTQHDIVDKLHNSAKDKRDTSTLKTADELTKLSLVLKKPCEDLPYFEMDESYTLTVSSNSSLVSDSIWGMLRGLETFSQLTYLSDDYSEVRLNATEIRDSPSYPHRGLLIDTSRHFLSVQKIMKILDAMEMNKMNVLHWHIIDDQSFPYVSEVLPDLSKGAYYHTMVYTKSDIKKLVDYARDRGIRIIPEFDMPSHATSWGAAFPDILTKCYADSKVTHLGPLNPIDNTTYKTIKTLLSEVQSRFPDKFFHLGGDEVETECWDSNPEIKKYMEQNNLDSVDKLIGIFYERVAPYLSNGTVPMVWHEMFDKQVSMDKKTVIQVWSDNYGQKMDKVLAAGYRVLLSSPWYLDNLKDTWQTFYGVNPRTYIKNSTLQHNVLGGEACMWGEKADDRNVIPRVWPRTSAIAERLWSPIPEKKNVWRNDIVADDYTKMRMEEHACRMIRRGINAEPPTGPGFCITNK